jgi:CheY-like chemotaxis protein
MTRLLLVEDDPVSRTFLTAALENLPAVVDTTASLAETLAGDSSQNLWLIDANLPDGSGTELLRKLRRHHPATPALAHTADATPATRDALLAAGFAAVLVKPLSAAKLLAEVRKALGLANLPTETESRNADTALPVWDDAAALIALKNNVDSVAALRQLFLADLPKQHAAIIAAAANLDSKTLHQELHRLKASCGFVGAARLQAIVTAFDHTLPDMSLLDEFNEVVRLTRQT